MLMIIIIIIICNLKSFLVLSEKKKKKLYLHYSILVFVYIHIYIVVHVESPLDYCVFFLAIIRVHRAQTPYFVFWSCVNWDIDSCALCVCTIGSPIKWIHIPMNTHTWIRQTLKKQFISLYTISSTMAQLECVNSMLYTVIRYEYKRPGVWVCRRREKTNGHFRTNL